MNKLEIYKRAVLNMPAVILLFIYFFILDGIQQIQSIITEIKNFGANTVILERLSTKAKEAFRKNNHETVQSSNRM